jgi:hypothetical protein
MATFTNNYETATANTPILSSAWNDNIEATKERFQKHDHNDEVDSGPQIGRSGLKAEVTDVLDSAAGYEARITELETQVADLTAQVAAITVSEAPVITGFDYTPPANTGNPVVIQGENFDTTMENNVVMFFNGMAIETVGDVTAAAESELTVTVPSGAQTGRVIVIVNGKVAISEDSIVIAPQT